jgi:hypothetical protein
MYLKIHEKLGRITIRCSRPHGRRDFQGFDVVEFLLRHIPKGKEASKLGKWLLDIYPDIDEALRNSSGRLLSGGIKNLWAKCVLPRDCSR